MKRFLSAFLGISLLLFLFAVVLNKSQNASAATATHIVISEIQIGGADTGTSTQDFIEIYNPTGLDVSLDGMRVGKRTSGTTSANVVIFASDDVVPAHGFFLWCNTSLNASLGCDSSGSGTIANDNSMALIDGSLAAGTVIDAVSLGTPGTTFGEGTSLTALTGGTSAERKANPTSTASSMASGGADEFLGNGEDTNNNSSDFIGRTTPQPQNSLSAIEPIGTPSVTPSIFPTVTMTPTNSPSPTVTPSTSPSPTVTLTTTPSVSPSPTSTPTVTISPTPIPSPAITTSPTPSVSPTPPIPTPKVIFSGPRFTCALHYRPLRFFNKTIFVPIAKCVHL